MRLDKFLANEGFGTRKEVKKLIKNGLVFVNNQNNLKDSDHINPEEDEVVVDGMLIDYHKNIYLMLNKPEDCVCANTDNVNETVFDYLLEFAHRPLFCVGRLDKDTTGLLLITDDGDFSHRITNPKKKINKVYHAYVDGHISELDIAYFNKGVIIDDDVKTKPAILKELSREGVNSWVEITIQEGKFHQVKKMLKAINLNTLHLNRVRVGNLDLIDDLALGDYKILDEKELEKIFE